MHPARHPWVSPELVAEVRDLLQTRPRTIAQLAQKTGAERNQVMNAIVVLISDPEAGVVVPEDRPAKSRETTYFIGK